MMVVVRLIHHFRPIKHTRQPWVGITMQLRSRRLLALCKTNRAVFVIIIHKIFFIFGTMVRLETRSDTSLGERFLV